MFPIRFDPLGFLDVAAGVLLLFTASALPNAFADFHAIFLIFKGMGSMLRPVQMPFPVYILGGAADLISAAILFTGQPPVLIDYKGWIGALLFLKGAWTLLGFMQG